MIAINVSKKYTKGKVMAQRRMFAKSVINSASFLKMPPSSQMLYFHLGMNADDDGIVEGFPIMRMVGASEDDLKILSAKRFVTVLNEDLVTHITDWLEHNLIRKDRKTDSKYKNLLLKINDDNQLTTIPRANAGEMSAQVRLGKVSIGKDSINKYNGACTRHAGACASSKKIIYTDDFESAWSYYPKRKGPNSKVNAFKQWTQRVNEGVSPWDMLMATKNYQIQMTNNQNIGTQFVMQAQRFYGAAKEYEIYVNIEEEELCGTRNIKISEREHAEKVSKGLDRAFRKAEEAICSDKGIMG